MRTPVRNGCLVAALLCVSGGVQADESRVLRANIVGCVKAVDGLGDDLRAPMQSHCLALAIARCERADSGPAARCFSDLTDTMQRYADALATMLDTDIPRAASDTLCTARHSSDTNRTRCVLVAEFGHLRDLFNAAKAARLDLP
ncbi:hypothetical protein [uncultured Tateyamaria sp.]|uniref:hypothetical protein n=1 Tax=uncultured Tateyamaria sp. TaxID=455651 RepID=UPI00261D1285|nr:hypothetical protein [uncultured Tateyamaria sp.]